MKRSKLGTSIVRMPQCGRSQRRWKVNVFHERRTDRSDSTRKALSLQLDACARQASADSMLLVDSKGLVVARGGLRDAETSEVAAFGPILAAKGDWRGTLGQGVPQQVGISPFRLGDQTAYLCAIGGNRHRLGGAVLRAKAGVRRILKRS